MTRPEHTVETHEQVKALVETEQRILAEFCDYNGHDWKAPWPAYKNKRIMRQECRACKTWRKVHV